MQFTDVFIRRPVLATVISLVILVLGLRSISMLGVREFPETQNAVVSVTTVYTGADPELVAGFITTPLENSIAQANGIDYMTSTSSQSVSMIKANLKLNYDANKAMTEINAKVNAVLNQLPDGAQQPTISVAVGESVHSMYLGFYSKSLPTNSISDYLIRVVQPKLQTVEGVQLAEILGGRQFAMRAWLDPQKLAAYGLTASDVWQALAANNYISAVGRTQGLMVTADLKAGTGLHTIEEFKRLVIRSEKGALIRLEDVANVTLGAESYDTTVYFDGENAVYIGIKVAPTANLLTVIKGVRDVFPSIVENMPQGIEGRIVYDATEYINNSIHEVQKTLVEALIIVTLVIFLFLGSLRLAFIPAVVMPLSLIGTFFIMFLLGYTINLLTLLALVLAIGIVVDDAIVVVENVHRHIEEGLPPLTAAVRSARELAWPVVATSVVLVVVYFPIGFMGGLTGALFTEFAFTLAGAIFISTILALTLSPVMCAKFLKSHDEDKVSKFAAWVDREFTNLRGWYDKALKDGLNHLPVLIVFAAIVLASNVMLYSFSKNELAPQEDPGFILSFYSTAPNATLDQTTLYSRQVFKTFMSYPETEHVFQIDGLSGLNSGIAGLVMKPWGERKRSSADILKDMETKLSQIAGANAAAFMPPSLPGGGEGLPIQMVIGGTDSPARIYEVSQAVLEKAQKSGMFIFVDSDLKIDKPQTEIRIDREKAAEMGLTMRDIGGALGSMLGGGYVNYFSLAGRSYKVIPQAMQSERLNAQQLESYYINTATGESIPLSTLVTLRRNVIPQSLNHFQQLNSATISGVPMPGVTLGDALNKLVELTRQTLPEGYAIDYAGQSRQLVKESNTFLWTFFFAMIIIFLSLAALFESFRDPLTVLISVPMSICGALIFVSLGIGGASLNIYTQVGLVTLIGLISKNGILIVQFANELQRQGLSKREAVETAAGIRLRPILMTTAATAIGVLPLVVASGPGAAGRFNIGIVIATGVSIGTFFTLFVVPAMYMLLARDRSKGKSDLAIEEAFR